MSIEDLPICPRNEVAEFLENELLPRWRKGNPTIFGIEPEHVDTRIEKTVKSVIANNGTYESGEYVFIDSSPAALPMAAEIGYVLENMGSKTYIIYELDDDPPLLNKLLTALPNRKSVERIAHQYGALFDFAQHCVITYATHHGEPSKPEREAVAALDEVENKAWSKLPEKLESGEIKSRDVIGFPVEHEAKQLGSSLSEWEPILYRAMSIRGSELEKEIDKTGFVKVLGDAYAGKTLRIIRKGDYPVNLTMKVKNRPIVKDVGRVGDNAIYGKYFERITNIPPGELFMAPLEDSVNGEFYAKLTQWTGRGTMEGVHVVFKDGRVVKATADKGEEALQYYTGLAKPETATMKDVYKAQNTIAELGIGVNPVLDFEKTTGNRLVNEKMRGIHIATGQNKLLGGNTPGMIGGIYVEHMDFIVGKIDEMVAL
nr:aminopeptidase [Candidatus Njordarchaeota archaeon]